MTLRYKPGLDVVLEQIRRVKPNSGEILDPRRSLFSVKRVRS